MRTPRVAGCALLLAACGGAPVDTGAAACAVAEPALERIDVATGYRVIDAPVDAP